MPAATYYIEGLSCQAMLAPPRANLHPMFSQFRPTEANSVGFGHSQQYDFTNPMAAIQSIYKAKYDIPSCAGSPHLQSIVQ
jgi:hypothetical protein